MSPARDDAWRSTRRGHAVAKICIAGSYEFIALFSIDFVKSPESRRRDSLSFFFNFAAILPLGFRGTFNEVHVVTHMRPMLFGDRILGFDDLMKRIAALERWCPPPMMATGHVAWRGGRYR